MSVIRDFRLPDLGEGLTESELVSWTVAVGDTVALNQVIAEVETAKALVELPSPFAGTVARLYAESGDTVNVGEPLVAFEVDVDAAGSASGGGSAGAGAESAPGDTSSAAAAAATAAETAPEPGPGPALTPASEPDAPPPNLVGYGAMSERDGHPVRRPRHGIESVGSAQASPAAADPSTVDPRPERPRSTPPVRRLAHDLGVDLAVVDGTGERGLVTRADVEAVAGGADAADAAHAADGSSTSDPAMSAVRREDVRIPIAGVRKRTAEAMVRSAFTAPTAPCS